MLKKYFIDDNKLEYEVSENSIGTYYFSYEKPIPLGTVRRINRDLCYLFQCYKEKRRYKLHWIKIDYLAN